MRGYLARLLGHALEGRVAEHVLPIYHGAGRNGKGTFIERGDGRARRLRRRRRPGAADRPRLSTRTRPASPTCSGCGWPSCTRPTTGRRLAEGTVKRLTGGDRLKARRMREDFWSFDPVAHVRAADQPQAGDRGTDEGIWRRLRLVPWDVVIPPRSATWAWLTGSRWSSTRCWPGW